MPFTCQITTEGLRVNIGPHQGSYPAWWKQIRVEVYGWQPEQGAVLINSGQQRAQMSREAERVTVVFSDDGKGMQVVAK